MDRSLSVMEIVYLISLFILAMIEIHFHFLEYYRSVFLIDEGLHCLQAQDDKMFEVQTFYSHDIELKQNNKK